MKVNAITIRPGNVLEYENKLMVVTKIDLIQPGKGNAVIQVEMKDIRTGTKTNNRWRTQETVERARLDEHEMQYLFSEGDLHTFMDQESFEQVAVNSDAIGDQLPYLQEGMVCTVTLHEGTPLSVELPGQVKQQVGGTCVGPVPIVDEEQQWIFVAGNVADCIGELLEDINARLNQLAREEAGQVGDSRVTH